MLPVILVAVGAYLIGDSVLEDKKLAKGGKTQGYDDKEDERLAMEHGKMSKKDLDSTHARRDDARFEERGKMAKGGKSKGLPKWSVTITSEDGDTFDWVGFAKNEDSALYEAEQKAGFDSVESGVTMISDENGKYIEYKKGGKLVGKQKNLDVNKNGKLDAEDFKMLRKGK
jgi:hypothetical protein